VAELEEEKRLQYMSELKKYPEYDENSEIEFPIGLDLPQSWPKKET
jgi:hypothetical protein